jgi:hypothetical protein
MALRDKISAAAQSHLQPGETVQTAFGAMGASPYWSLLSYWIVVVKDANRAVVATDRRILLFRTSRMRWTTFKRLEAEVPRATLLGEPSGMNWKCSAFGQTIWVNKRFHKDVRETDAQAAAGAPLPPPPAPSGR